MLRFLRRAKTEVQTHWYAPLLDFESSVSDFYAAVEAELKAHDFPDVFVERVVFKEGGLLSSGREYLRIRRERILFDVGGSPFGDAWYYTCRGCVQPRRMYLWEILLALATLGSFTLIYLTSFGMILGGVVLLATLIAVAALMMNAGSWPGLDDFLLNLPVAGGLYEIFFRRETYHRQDSRRMFIDVVTNLVRGKVEEDARTRGDRDVQFIDVANIEQTMGFRALAKEAFLQLWESSRKRRSGGKA